MNENNSAKILWTESKKKMRKMARYTVIKVKKLSKSIS